MGDDEQRRMDRVEDRFELHCRESAAVHAALAEGLTELRTVIRETRRQTMIVLPILTALLVALLQIGWGVVSPRVSHSTATPQVQR